MSIISLIEKKIGAEEIVTTPQLKEFGLSRGAAKKFIKTSGIQHVNFGNKIIFSKSDFIDFLKKSSKHDHQG